MNNKKYYVYILECRDTTLYIGITTDLKKRLDAHNGLVRGGAKYTKGRRPLILKYYEEHTSENSARKREWELKKLTRNNKLKLLEKFSF